MLIPELRINDFDYDLPQERIAQFPPENRDASKLLVWRNGTITESVFSDIDQEIPEESLLVFNDTKVVRARLVFSKPTGATIEIFCLEPLPPVTDIQAAFTQTKACTWKCLVGNVKRWKEGNLEMKINHQGTPFLLTAEKRGNLGEGCFAIEFQWEPENLAFSSILEHAGLVPLPPYIERISTSDDSRRYQTIYAKFMGSVAAPTAGLHFTPSVLDKLRKKNSFANVTLHVGIGTFRPVSEEMIRDHHMHAERISVTLDTLIDLINQKDKPVIAVGTTSVRTLESLYWLGVKFIVDKTTKISDLEQWDPYDERYDKEISYPEALTALAKHLEQNGLDHYEGFTSLMIVPGYKFRIIRGMITNFHMPKSTLLMLVAAFANDGWKTAYDYALLHNFRFLSYGDVCLFYK